MDTKISSNQMKAIVNSQYGSPDVLQLKEIERPTPWDHEVLIKICAVAVNAADWHLLRAEPFLVRLQFGLFKPGEIMGQRMGQGIWLGAAVVMLIPVLMIFSH